MDESFSFTIGGEGITVTRDEFERRVLGEDPEPYRKYYVEIGGKRYPIRQAVELGLHTSRAGFTTQRAYGILRKMRYKPVDTELKH